MARRLLAAALAALALAVAGCSEAGLDASNAPTRTAGQAVGPDGKPIVEAGQKGADFSVPSLDDGDPITLADYRGKPLVLNFWASWCGPCKRELPDLVAFATAHPEIAVLGLAVNDDPSDSRKFAEKYRVDYDLGVDDRARVAGEYGATGLPVTIYLDREGRILGSRFGGVTEADLDAFAKSVA
ncbi:MAG: cytochrome c biosis protein CcmG, thiol:disulfide interchange protein DsbE [Miltoncostaeaceae bacterium]|jgi:cytochrome c biogenesis protein CcmG/thiol:disulfide interchange protein DsbE|nr:cytochrome c biosis protein CcmG, thiol:disulfide interchange protein DsbE [Miltoncostaeaceae bacterium]